MPDAKAIAAFIARWKDSGGNELANAQPFLKELCEVLDLPRHEAAKSVNEDNAYSFERKVRLPLGDGTSEMKRLDLYKRGCFVLEAKQGQEVRTKTPLSLPMPGLTKSSAVKRGSRAWDDQPPRVVPLIVLVCDAYLSLAVVPRGSTLSRGAGWRPVLADVAPASCAA